MHLRWAITLLLGILITGCAAKMCRAAEDVHGQSRLRYPVALALLPSDLAGGPRLVTANSRSGSLSLVDLRTEQTVAELDIGRCLSDIQRVGDRLLVTDEKAHELIVVEFVGGQMRVQQRVPVSPYPVKVTCTADGARCYVASLWSRQLCRVDLAKAGESRRDKAEVTAVLDLPFAPRELLLLRDDSVLLVGDAFGGRLGVVDTGPFRLSRTREFPAHNIRSLALSVNREMLVVTHQMLNSLAHTVRNDVHWGLLMSNDLRWLRLDNVLAGDDDLYRGAHMHPLGEAGSAAGDPAGMDVAANGTVVVALSGVGQIAIGKEDEFSLERIRVGGRPTAVEIDSDGEHAFVTDTFGDRIIVVNLEQRKATGNVSLGPQRKLTEAERGERLFYDARLSHDGWMSCHSCHTDGHTNGEMNDNFSDKSFGAPKRVLSLLGRLGTAPFAWNASADDLETQVRKSVQHTMQSDTPPSDEQVKAIGQFVRSLNPPPPIDQLRGRQDDARVGRGRAVFDRLRCARCHAPPVYTTPRTYDVGLEDKLGKTQFNPPSLRGVGQRGPYYFHDNRAKTLADVFRTHNHKLPTGELDKCDLDDLLAFLRSL